MTYLSFSLKTELKKQGVDDAVSLKIISSVEDAIRGKFGGGDHYVPAKSTALRNELIIKEHLDGRSVNQIADKFSLHRSTISRIIAHRSGSKSQ